MFGNNDLHEMYAESLRHHSFGYALYHPCPSTVLTPGSIGYFDNVGEWIPMEFDSFKALVAGMKMGEIEHAKCGPITTKQVTQVSLSASANLYPSHFTYPISNPPSVNDLTPFSPLLCNKAY
jgi:hypothetical protein